MKYESRESIIARAKAHAAHSVLQDGSERPITDENLPVLSLRESLDLVGASSKLEKRSSLFIKTYCKERTRLKEILKYEEEKARRAGREKIMKENDIFRNSLTGFKP